MGSLISVAGRMERARILKDEDEDRRRIAERELSQARYDASLAEHRHAACYPDNRLIAAQLEKPWETALQRVEACRQRLDSMATPTPMMLALTCRGVERAAHHDANPPEIGARAGH